MCCNTFFQIKDDTAKRKLLTHRSCSRISRGPSRLGQNNIGNVQNLKEILFFSKIDRGVRDGENFFFSTKRDGQTSQWRRSLSLVSLENSPLSKREFSLIRIFFVYAIFYNLIYITHIPISAWKFRNVPAVIANVNRTDDDFPYETDCSRKLDYDNSLR